MANAERLFTGTTMQAPERPRQPAWGGMQRIVAALILTIALAASLFALRSTVQADMDSHELFPNWGRPDVAIILTGEMHGYLQPCGCSRPQFGGLARRYNFIQELKNKGWNIVAMDLGDVAQTSGAVFEQRQLKYSTAMKALDLMGYTAVGLGTHEFSYPLFEALSTYSLNNATPPVLAANLLKRNEGELFHNLNVKSWAISQGGTGPKVGVVGAIGPSVITQVRDPDASFLPNNAHAIYQALIELRAQKADVNVLLYQGSFKEAEFAARYFESYPQIPKVDMIVCLSEASEPPGLPRIPKGSKTPIIEIGHKGRFCGVVGVYGSGPQRRLQYQLVSIGEQYEAANNPVKKLMQDYAAEVKRNNHIKDFPRTKHSTHVHFPNAKYVGSKRCGDCHEHAYDVWKESKHAHAFDTLKKAHDPGLREFDGECVKCHVVGFGHHTGFLDQRNDARINARLEHVGCESCHGPGSAHIDNPRDTKLYALMNPYKTHIAELQPHVVKQRLNLIDISCQRCHDTDNDVHWTFEKWKEIAHPTPPPAGANGKSNPPAAGVTGSANAPAVNSAVTPTSAEATKE